MDRDCCIIVEDISVVKDLELRVTLFTSTPQPDDTTGGFHPHKPVVLLTKVLDVRHGGTEPSRKVCSEVTPFRSVALRGIRTDLPGLRTGDPS